MSTVYQPGAHWGWSGDEIAPGPSPPGLTEGGEARQWPRCPGSWAAQAAGLQGCGCQGVGRDGGGGGGRGRRGFPLNYHVHLFIYWALRRRVGGRGFLLTAVFAQHTFGTPPPNTHTSLVLFYTCFFLLYPPSSPTVLMGFFFFF